jgi:hypothetical protein
MSIEPASPPGLERLRSRLWARLLGGWLAGALSACTPLIGPYSPVAYQNATSLKVETLALMDKASEPYEQHKAEAEALFVEARKAEEYDKGVPSNGISAAQWHLLIRPDGDLMGKFFTRWSSSSTKVLNRPFIDEMEKLVSDGFDEIICLEANQKQGRSCTAGAQS